MHSIIEPFATLTKVRKQSPLVHHITNWVTISECASMTRSTGALPVMAHAKEEVVEMVGIASALVLNIGTLTPELIDSMIKAGKAANKKGIPVILDAVGAGATKLRTDSAKKLLSEVKITVLKGNYGEIGVLAGAAAEVKGVESISVEGDIAQLAFELARVIKGTVVATGVQDIVSDGVRTFRINNGHYMMGQVVGTGCMASSVIGAFTAVEVDTALACAHALSCYGIAGEIAATLPGTIGPMTFKPRFFDCMHHLSESDVKARFKVGQE